MKTTVVAVLIAQEHLPYIRDWCEHHLNLGFDKITLYDNTGSVGSNRSSSAFRIKSHLMQKKRFSKRGVPYAVDLPNKDAKILLKNILKDIPVEIIDWQPTNTEGEIIHGQVEAYVEYIRNNRDKIDWTCFIDADEYLSAAPHWNFKDLLLYAESHDVNRIYLNVKRYCCRELYDHRIYLETISGVSGKNIIKIRDAVRADIHYRWEMKNMFCFTPDINNYWVDHFNGREETKRIVGTFSEEIPLRSKDDSIPIFP